MICPSPCVRGSSQTAAQRNGSVCELTLHDLDPRWTKVQQNQLVLPGPNWIGRERNGGE